MCRKGTLQLSGWISWPHPTGPCRPVVWIHSEWGIVFKVVALGAHPYLLLPVTYPLNPTGLVEFSGVPPPTGTQTSIIMADSPDTLSLATCVRFHLPVTSVMFPLVALTTLLDLAITQGSSGLLAGQAVPSGFTCSPEQKELWEKGGLASCPTQLCTPHPGPT